MKHIKIRKSAFETNSSSTHALVIKKETPLKLPEEVFFGLGEFGWEKKKYDDTSVKCKYLHTAIFYRFVGYEANRKEYYKYRNKITEILKNYNIKAIWEDVRKISNKNAYQYYIDHCDELEDFIDLVISVPEMLIDWLFNNESLLITDNDNSEMEYYEEAFNKYDGKEGYFVYGKGN